MRGHLQHLWLHRGRVLVFFLIVHSCSIQAFAETVEYDLTIGYKTVNYTGRDVRAMAINSSIPGPTLRFKEGDFARIRVHNEMDEETSVHWHGLLLPNLQDGVPYLTTPPIKPKTTHTFEFPLIHSGTYWYHSHTGLQEQAGVYGSIVIEPKEQNIRVDKEYVLVLSDWTDENPDEVLRTLKRGSEYYAFKRGSIQNLVGAIKADALGDMFRSSLMRMPPMDISDVAYDRFLINGKPETTLADAQPGETVRLRIINASASTYYYLQFAGGPLTIVSADGMDVQPVKLDRFLIAIAETYDVLVNVPRDGLYELRATSQDGSGRTSAWLGSGQRMFAPDVPKPNLYKMLMGSEMMHGEMGKMSENSSMAKSSHEHMMMGMMDDRPLAPYAQLRSLQPTALKEEAPRRTITLTLTGNMERYVWHFDNKTLSEADMIPVKKGEVLRIVFVNETMMHHPIHLHGHFFRVLNEQGDYAPLKHTVDIPPSGRQEIEFLANEEKDWFIHCHILYHMKAGMARVLHYEGSKMDPDIAAIRHNLFKDHWYAWADASLLTHMTDGLAVLSSTRHTLGMRWEIGWGKVKETEYDIELTYDYHFVRFLSAFGGANLTNDSNAGIFGVRYLLPLNLESLVWVDTDGDFRFSVGKKLWITNRLSFFGEAEYDTNTKWEGVVGAAWIVNKWLSLVGQWHSDFGTGAGIRIRF
ncbi:MAG: multicopper oxidase domain-containing protein [Thermodesulfovibrionia bacterium]|nr:multicopper oxidase domain-containing protein [Thermodesulfovibrionia bacterium]